MKWGEPIRVACFSAGVYGFLTDGLVFELGLRRHAPPLVRYRSGDIEAPTTQASPAACQRRAA
jgi:hypothetical protein